MSIFSCLFMSISCLFVLDAAIWLRSALKARVYSCLFLACLFFLFPCLFSVSVRVYFFGCRVYSCLFLCIRVYSCLFSVACLWLFVSICLAPALLPNPSVESICSHIYICYCISHLHFQHALHICIFYCISYLHFLLHFLQLPKLKYCRLPFWG